jgi:hypothetical protein
MSLTIHLKQPLADEQTAVDCESVALKGSCAHVDRGVAEDALVVPMDNVAGIEGGEVDQAVEQLPTQGGQYTEVVTRIE